MQHLFIPTGEGSEGLFKRPLQDCISVSDAINLEEFVTSLNKALPNDDLRKSNGFKFSDMSSICEFRVLPRETLIKPLYTPQEKEVIIGDAIG